MTWSFPRRKATLIAVTPAVTAACTYSAATGDLEGTVSGTTFLFNPPLSWMQENERKNEDV